MCGFGGRLGRSPVAIEAARLRWYSQDGPDDIANAIALPLLSVRPGRPSIDVIYVNWHTSHVFRSHGHRAA
jgi:hypothetical protein